MKKTYKIFLFNVLFSLIYLLLYFILSLGFENALPFVFDISMKIGYFIITLVAFLIFGKALSLKDKKYHLISFLIFCAISSVTFMLYKLLNINIFVIFNSAPMLFGVDNIDDLFLYFPKLINSEIDILLIMWLENAAKILFAYLGSKLAKNINADAVN